MILTTPEELSGVTEIADVKEKTIVNILALSGIGIGTLVKLTYGHVRKDLEAGIVPIHIHVEKEITKGKYQDYDTFIGLNRNANATPIFHQLASLPLSERTSRINALEKSPTEERVSKNSYFEGYSLHSYKFFMAFFTFKIDV